MGSYMKFGGNPNSMYFHCCLHFFISFYLPSLIPCQKHNSFLETLIPCYFHCCLSFSNYFYLPSLIQKHSPLLSLSLSLQVQRFLHVVRSMVLSFEKIGYASSPRSPAFGKNRQKLYEKFSGLTAGFPHPTSKLLLVFFAAFS